MTQARLYLVAFDISCPRRWRRAVTAMKKICRRAQLSVFLCRAAPARMLRLEQELKRILHHRDDRLIILDLGQPAGTRSDRPFGALNPMSEIAELAPLII